MVGPNYIKNVAIVGAGGNSGKYMTEALLKTGKHTVTAITRSDSQSKIPEGAIVKTVNYDDPSTIVEALKGQDALVITVSAFAGKDVQAILIEAAGKAEVPWVLPNEWAPDTANEELTKDVMVFQTQAKARRAASQLPKTSYIAVSTSFWYEWSLAIPAAYGFDFDSKSVTFFDDGNTKINTSTWPQVGRAVAGLLSLPIQPESGDSEHCLENFKNKIVYLSSFLVSQNDMFESVLRVTGDKREDWKVEHVPATKRYQEGLVLMQKGVREGFAHMMYTRVFYQDGVGNVEKKHGTINRVLGLPEEDLDEATKAAIKRAQTVPHVIDTTATKAALDRGKADAL